jgi:Dockerin type I domain/Putative Ig domain/Cadherin domain/Bacterial Ig domain
MRPQNILHSSVSRMSSSMFGRRKAIRPLLRGSSFHLETLENRSLLASIILDTDNVTVPAATDAVAPLELTLTNSTDISNIAFTVKATGTGTNPIDPGVIRLLAETGTGSFASLASSDNVDGTTSSMATFSVPAGKYRIEVANVNDVAGTIQLDVMLVGDKETGGLTGNRGAVSEHEELLASGALVQALGSANFVTVTYYRQRGIDLNLPLFDSAFDGNLNGRMDGDDLRMIQTNRVRGTITGLLAPDRTAPTFSDVRLTNDTGPSGTNTGFENDRVSTNAGIQGTITDTASPVTRLEASLDTTDASRFVDVSNALTGSAGLSRGFSLSQTLINNLLVTGGGTLAEGPHTIRFRATDAASNVSTVQTFEFTFIVDNVAPTVSTPITDATTNEDAPFTKNVATSFADADVGDTRRFTATVGANNGALPSWLTLNAATGAFSGTPLQANIGTITVNVTGTDSQGLTVSDSFTITVNAVNDAPVITNTVRTLSVREGAPDGTSFGQVLSTDEEGDTVTYSIVSGNTDNALALNSTTGLLTIADRNAVVGKTSFTLVIQASDGDKSDTETFTVNVTENRDPVVADQTRSIRPGAVNGANVGQPIAATDLDGDALEYLISGGNANGAFAINGATGQITVNNASALPALGGSQALTITVRDSFFGSDTATVTINVRNNAEPVVNNQAFNVATGTANGTAVYTVVATDDDGDALTFAITGGNANGAFAINASTGVITVANSAAVAAGTQALTIQVSDAFPSSDTATVTATIRANAAPVAPDRTFTLPAGFVNGTSVGIVTATDANSDPLTFAITGGNANGAFAINANSGQITVANAANVGTATRNLTVTVTDTFGGSDTAAITINVPAANVAPVVNDQTFTVAAGAPNGTTVGTVAATDANGDSLTFTILSGNTGGAFAINASTGVITVANSAALPAASAVLVVQASDGRGGTDSGNITINVSAQTDLVRIRLRAFDSNGNAITSIDPNGIIEIRGFIQDLRANARGPFTAFTDVTFDPTRATPIAGSIVHSPTFATTPSGAFGNGVLDEVGGLSGLSDTGSGELEFFRARFTAAGSAGAVTFTADPADNTNLHAILLFGLDDPVDVGQIDFGTVTVAVGGFGSPSGIGETAPVTNPNNPYDVNGDDQVNALDALMVINRLGATTSGTGTSATPVYLDVNGDGYATAIDALRIINYLTSNRSAMGIAVTDGEDDEDEGAGSEFDAVDAIFASDEENLF